MANPGSNYSPEMEHLLNSEGDSSHTPGKKSFFWETVASEAPLQVAEDGESESDQSNTSDISENE